MDGLCESHAPDAFIPQDCYHNLDADALPPDEVQLGASSDGQQHTLDPSTTDWPIQDILWTPQFLADDFDMSLFEFASANMPHEALLSASGSADTPSTRSFDSHRPEIRSIRQARTGSRVQRSWHTFCESPSDDSLPDLTQSRDQVDETYHSSLTDSFRLGKVESSIPRISFLVRFQAIPCYGLTRRRICVFRLISQYSNEYVQSFTRQPSSPGRIIAFFCYLSVLLVACFSDLQAQ